MDAAYKPASYTSLRRFAIVARSLSKTPLFACGGFISALWANESPVNLGFGLDLLPSPMLTYFMLRAFGPIAGIATAFGGALRTIELWGHPWAAIEMVIQPLFVLWCWRRSRWQGLISLVIYWPLIGAPFILFSYGILLGYDPVSLETVTLKQALNSLSGFIIGNIACFIIASLSPASLPFVSKHGVSAGSVTSWLLTLCTIVPSFIHLNYNARLEEASFNSTARDAIRGARNRYDEFISAIMEENRRLVQSGSATWLSTQKPVEYFLLTYLSDPEKNLRSASLRDMKLAARELNISFEDARALLNGNTILDESRKFYFIGFNGTLSTSTEDLNGTTLRQLIVAKKPVDDLLFQLDTKFNGFLRTFVPANPETGDPAPNILASSRKLCSIGNDRTQIASLGEEGLYKLEPLTTITMSPMQAWLNSCYFGIIQVNQDLFFLFASRRTDQIFTYRINARNLMRLDALIIFTTCFFGIAISQMMKRKMDEFSAALVGAGVSNSLWQRTRPSALEEFRVLDRGLEQLTLTLQTQRSKTRELLSQMNALLSSAPSVIYGASINQQQITIDFCSPSLRNVLGIPLETFKDIVLWHRLILPPDRAIRLNLIASASLSGKGYAEYRIQEPSGELRWIREHLLRDKSSASNTTFVGGLLDVTTQKEAELRMIQSSKMLTLGEMATGMAHELNQPLNIVALTADNALLTIEDLRAAIRVPGHKDHVKQLVDVDEIKFRLERITKQIERAGKLIHHMRIFGRTADTAQETLDPAQLIEDAISLLEQQFRLKDIKIEKVVETDLPRAKGHLQLLEQVIVNLLLNSRDAILEKRESSHEESMEEDKIEISINRVPGALPLSITVRDTGGGIPANHIEKVFQPFFTTKPPGKGTGLGLSICYGIVTEMGGQIIARNENGGAALTILLPEI